MKEFRIGQRVRVMKMHRHAALRGSVGTIISKGFDMMDRWCQEVDIDDVPADGADPWCGPIECFEPIDDDAGDWRVSGYLLNDADLRVRWIVAKVVDHGGARP